MVNKVNKIAIIINGLEKRYHREIYNFKLSEKHLSGKARRKIIRSNSNNKLSNGYSSFY